VVTETFDVKGQAIRVEAVFYPTAKGLIGVGYATQASNFAASSAARDTFFTDGVRFDSAAAGGGLADLLRTAASGLAGFQRVADTKLKLVYTDTHKTKKIVKKKLTQAKWDSDVAWMFAAIAGGADISCDDAGLSCTVQEPAGDSLEYRFRKTKKGPVLKEV